MSHVMLLGNFNATKYTTPNGDIKSNALTDLISFANLTQANNVQFLQYNA